MPEFIDRKDALTAIEGYQPLDTDYRDAWSRALICSVKSDLADDVREIPSAYVRIVHHGMWVDDDGEPVGWCADDGRYPRRSCRCSVCGFPLAGSDNGFSIGVYCPNCGSDMCCPANTERSRGIWLS